MRSHVLHLKLYGTWHFDTLAYLRLAAEQGKVHPIYIDAISSQFAKQIEAITSIQSGLQLQMDMVKEYCLLVKKRLPKGKSHA